MLLRRVDLLLNLNLWLLYNDISSYWSLRLVNYHARLLHLNLYRHLLRHLDSLCHGLALASWLCITLHLGCDWNRILLDWDLNIFDSRLSLLHRVNILLLDYLI